LAWRVKQPALNKIYRLVATCLAVHQAVPDSILDMGLDEHARYLQEGGVYVGGYFQREAQFFLEAQGLNVYVELQGFQVAGKGNFFGAAVFQHEAQQAAEFLEVFGGDVQPKVAQRVSGAVLQFGEAAEVFVKAVVVSEVGEVGQHGLHLLEVERCRRRVAEVEVAIAQAQGGVGAFGVRYALWILLLGLLGFAQPGEFLRIIFLTLFGARHAQVEGGEARQVGFFFQQLQTASQVKSGAVGAAHFVKNVADEVGAGTQSMQPIGPLRQVHAKPCIF